MSVERDDESTFSDLLVCVLNHRRSAALALVLGFLATAAFVVLMPVRHELSTVIEIGRVGDNAVESADTVLNKVSQAYAQPAVRTVIERHPEFTFVPEVKSSNPKGSSLVVLTSVTTAYNEDVYREIHNEVVQRLVNDHLRVLTQIRKRLELDLNQALGKAEDIGDQLKTLSIQVTTMDEEKKLVRRQLDQISKQIDQAQTNRQSAGQNVDNQAKALTLLMVDNQLQADRNRQSVLEERMVVGEVNEARRLEQQIADTKREQSVQNDRISGVRAAIANFQETRAVVPPQRSLKPVSFPMAARIAIGVVLSFLATWCAGLFAAWMERIRARMLAQG